METFEFPCGGDHGGWDSVIDVCLTDEQVNRLKEYAKKEEFICDIPSVRDIYQLAYDALLSSCVDNIDRDYYKEIREDYMEDEDDSKETIVARLLDAEGFVIRVPYELRDDM